MTPANGVVVVGDVLVDELVAADGSRERRPGGAGLNLALSVRRLGARATLAAPLAADADGAWLTEVARSGGVEVIPLPHSGSTGIAESWRTDGEPEYRFSPSVHARHYAWDGELTARVAAAGSVLVVNSFPIGDAVQVADLAALAERTGQRLVVDPNVRPSLTPDVPAYRKGFLRLAGRADVVKLSVQDVAALGIADHARLVDDLFAAGVRVVLLTRGAGGAVLVTASGLRLAVPVPDRPEPVVDTMGAGDAALAVLAAGVAGGGLERDAEQWRALTVAAMDAAADVCRVAGGSLPDLTPRSA